MCVLSRCLVVAKLLAKIAVPASSIPVEFWDGLIIAPASAKVTAELLSGADAPAMDVSAGGGAAELRCACGRPCCDPSGVLKGDADAQHGTLRCRVGLRWWEADVGGWEAYPVTLCCQVQAMMDCQVQVVLCCQVQTGRVCCPPLVEMRPCCQVQVVT